MSALALVGWLLVVVWALGVVGVVFYLRLTRRPRRRTEVTIATSSLFAADIGKRITGPGITPNTYVARAPTATSLTVATGGRWLKARLRVRRAWALR